MTNEEKLREALIIASGDLAHLIRLAKHYGNGKVTDWSIEARERVHAALSNTAPATPDDEALRDAVAHGTGATMGGKHIPLDELYQQPAPADDALTERNIGYKILMALGQYRDDMPDAAVSWFQELVDEYKDERARLDKLEAEMQKIHDFTDEQDKRPGAAIMSPMAQVRAMAKAALSDIKQGDG